MHSVLSKHNFMRTVLFLFYESNVTFFEHEAYVGIVDSATSYRLSSPTTEWSLKEFEKIKMVLLRHSRIKNLTTTEEHFAYLILRRKI